METSSPSSKPRSRTEWAVATLRQAILRGEFRPGEKLVTSVLEQRLSVSQTPVREALQRLGSEGLVELSAQHGARVAPVSTTDMLEIYEVRMILEPVAITRSLQAADTAFHMTLSRSFSALKAVLEADTGDMWEFERHHRAFHHALVAACDSRWMLRMVGQLVDHSVRYRLLSWTPRGGSPDILAEHAGIYEAATAGDVQGTRDLTYRHLRHTVNAVFDALAAPGTEPAAGLVSPDGDDDPAADPAAPISS